MEINLSNPFVDACRDEGLDCSICLEPFKNPRKIIVCSHTFCLECITEVADHAIPKNISPTCPTCRAPFTIKDLRENDKINWDMKELRAKFKNEEPKPIEPALFPSFVKVQTTLTKLYDLVSMWPLRRECEPETVSVHQAKFLEIVNEVVNSFIEEKLPRQECEQITKILKKFRKDVQGASDIPPNRRDADYPDGKKEILGLSQNLWEHLNYVLNVLEPNLPQEVLEHVSFSRNCLKFPSSQDARQYSSQILQKAREEKPEQCHYLLRPSTRGRGNDTTQKFTLSYMDTDGKSCACRLGRKPEGWIIYDVTANNDEIICGTLGTLDEAIIHVLKDKKGKISPIDSEFLQKLDKSLIQ